MNLIVTLAEKDHFCGAFALFNSAVRSGFSGTFVIGYRDFVGVSAKMIRLLKKIPFHIGGARLELVKLETARHFTNYKPDWMKICLEKWPQAEHILYVDPDIVLTCPWPFLVRWMNSGVALCSDVNWYMPPDHPIRHEWRQVLVREGLAERNKPIYYLNGGFLGLGRRDFDFLSTWEKFVGCCAEGKNALDAKGDIGRWRKGGRWDRFYSPDQDALNMAAMAWPGALAYVGPDAMGFIDGDLYCPHAVGSAKPWRRWYFLEAFLGLRPRMVDIKFWENVSGPIRVFDPWTVMWRKFAIRMALAIGRFYRKAS